MDSLTDIERQMLDLEAQWWATVGGKEDAIRELGMSAPRYYQLLNRLLGAQKAVAYAPVTVTRLQRIRAREYGAADSIRALPGRLP